VTSYESFWLATAAAAPVIALAAVIALPDASGIYREDIQHAIDEWAGNTEKLRSTLRTAGFKESELGVVHSVDFPALKKSLAKTTLLFRVIADAVRWTAIGNVLLQAVLLAFSLTTLAYNVEVLPRWVAVVLTVGGILLLAVTVSLVSAYRRRASEVAKAFELGDGPGQRILKVIAEAVFEAQDREKRLRGSDTGTT
jgi:hypothetical protein